jgi:capsular exopolysaccharide synthesis family protein
LITTDKEIPWNLRDLLNLIFKHKLKIITVFLAVVAVVTALTFRAAPIYEASSKILVKFGRENVFEPTLVSQQGRSPILFNSSREEGINSKVEILKGRNLLKEVIIRLGINTIYPGITEDPASASGGSLPLEKAILSAERGLSVEAIPDSDIIRINFKHKDPLISAQFVNELVSVFLDYHLSLYKESEKYDFLEEQVRLQKKILRDSEKKLEAFKKQNNISSLAMEKELLLAQISDVELALSVTESEISKKEGELKSLRGDSSAASKKTVMGEETEFNPYATSNLRTRVSELKLEELDLLGKYTEQSTRVKDIRQEIENAQRLLYEEEQIYHNKALISIGHNLNALKSAAANQRNQLAEYRKTLSSLNSTELELNELERQFEIDETNYKLYVNQLEEARIANAMDTEKFANISVVEPAIAPLKPVSPNKRLNVMLAMFLGLLLGCGVAVFSEVISHTFDKNEDIEKHLALPVLASIPEPEPHKPVDLKLSSHISKEYLSLRHNLISSTVDTRVKKILFCASAKGEGNSTVLSNFAITLASIGNKVLVVDANLRDPSLHNVFELDKKDGLNELLLGEKSLDDVIKQTRFEHLSVITCGAALSHFFTSESLNSFIEKVEPFFDWILFDSPPIHSCNESRTIAAKVDCVVMVAQAESTRWEVAQSAKAIIENKKIKILGAVLNRRKWHIPAWIYNRL